MTEMVEFSGIAMEVTRKNIKNVHLSVCPPAGAVRISIPMDTNLDAVRMFAASKIGWIRQHQKRYSEQERETPREYVNRESHYVWGRRCLLTVVEEDTRPYVLWSRDSLRLVVRPETNAVKKDAILNAWYRQEVRRYVMPLIEKWQPIMRVQVSRLLIQKMKTQWGSCNSRDGNIRLNSELAKKPPACLEYVVVHEMVHLLERLHNKRFVRLMDGFLPQWRQLKDTLNRSPLSFAKWSYD